MERHHARRSATSPRYTLATIVTMVAVVVLDQCNSIVGLGTTSTHSATSSNSLPTSPTHSLSASRALDGCTTAEHLQVDVATLLVTAPALSAASSTVTTRIGPTALSSQIANTANGNGLPRSPTDVRGIVCHDDAASPSSTSGSVSQAAANRMCFDTYGPGFTAVVGSMAWPTALGRADVVHRFPLIGSMARLRLACPDGVLVGDAAATSDGTSLAACALCNGTSGTDGSTLCPALLTVSCRAPAIVQRYQYAPLRLLAPPQWVNSTVAVRSVTDPPQWFAQALCPPRHVATVAAGYGVVGDDVTGLTSGLDTLQYGFLQFSVVCDAGDTNMSVASSCWVQPSASAEQVVGALGSGNTSSSILVNVSQSMIVNCEATDAATPPLNTHTPSHRVANCTFSLRPLDGSILDGGRSLIDGYLHASCSGAAMGTTLPYHTCFDATTMWADVVVPLCQASGFDHGTVLGGSVAGFSPGVVSSTFQLAPSTNTSYVVRLSCPKTYFIKKLIQQDFQSCGLTVAAVGLSGSVSPTATAACSARVMRCFDVPPPEPRIEWIVGTTIFCATVVVATAVSCVGTYLHRNARRGPNEARRRSRIRVRSSSRNSSSSVGSIMLGSSSMSSGAPHKAAPSPIYSPSARGAGGSSSSADLHRSISSEGNDPPEL